MKESFISSEIGKLVSPIKTWNPPRSNQTKPFLYIDLSSIDQKEKRIVAFSKILPKEAPSRARQLVLEGDVLVSTVRPYLNGVAHVPRELDGATASTGFCVLRPRQEKLVRRYLYHWVQSSDFVKQMVKFATGANYPAVSDRIIKNSQIPLPPLSEQKRIAAILDKADAIRRKRQQAIKLADDFLRATFLDMFGDPVTNPKGWHIVHFEEAISDIIGGWSANGLDRPAASGEKGVLKISAITSGHFLSSENKAVVNIDPRREGFLVYPNKGDLLFSRANTRELVSATCIVRREEPQLFLPDKIWKIVPKKGKANAIYLKYLLTHQGTRNNLNNQASGTSGSMLNISKQKVKAFAIPLPPINQQNIFSEVYYKASMIRDTKERAHQEASELFTSLTQRAFRGGL